MYANIIEPHLLAGVVEPQVVERSPRVQDHWDGEGFDHGDGAQAILDGKGGLDKCLLINYRKYLALLVLRPNYIY